MTNSCRIRVDGGREKRRRRMTLEGVFDNHVSTTLICFVLFAIAALVDANAEMASEKASSSSSAILSSSERKLIINGDSVEFSDNQFFVRSWPDSVSETKDVLCGASLIHSDMIITAAHCHGGFNYGAMTYDPESQTLSRYKTVDMQLAYPRYYENLNIINYDILLLRLDSPITDVEPIEINDDPDIPVKKKDNSNDQSYLLEGLGVGLTETGMISRGLEVGYFNAMANDQCSQRLGKVNVAMTEDIMCADPITDDSICAGDSGGPLSTRINVSKEATSRSPWNELKGGKPLLVGITSFGNDCAVDLVPDGFARISFFNKWINEQICKYSRDPPGSCFEYYETEEYLEFVAAETSNTIWPKTARMTMEFQHDFLAEQTVFVFRNTITNKIAYVGPQYVPRRGEFVVSTFSLPVPANYAIEIYDNGGDGLKNPKYINKNYPQGNWTLSAEYSNGGRLENLASGDFDFKSKQTKFIMLPRRMRDPTAAPTETVAPTVTPKPTGTVATPAIALNAASSSATAYSTCTWAFAVIAIVWVALL